MDKRIKKLVACIAMIGMFCGVSTNVLADATTIGVDQTYSLATITNGTETIEVPVVQETIRPRSVDGAVTSKSTVWIPDMTEESLEQNKNLVGQIKQRMSGIAPRDMGIINFPDNNFITFTSTIVYNVQYYNNTFRMYDIISFRLDREIHTMAPYDSVHNATAQANQIGTIGDPADGGKLMEQSKEFGEIQYGTTYTTPSEWLPVWPPDYGGPRVGVVYNIPINYSAQSGLSDYTLRQLHEVV